MPPAHIGPGQQDAAGVPGGEAQPAARRELLLPAVLLNFIECLSGQDVIIQVQLEEAIRDLSGKMDTELAEYGSNFSIGQQQLVCLARAILRKNWILIIDKATSHVDPRTDELIKKEIHEKFAQCTILTIAHRLSNINDSEWIMVLDSGRMKEYGRPYDLLQNTNSLFYKMVQQLGEAEAAALTERAEQIHLKKK